MNDFQRRMEEWDEVQIGWVKEDNQWAVQAIIYDGLQVGPVTVESIEDAPNKLKAEVENDTSLGDD
jgi:hypothetical protein